MCGLHEKMCKPKLYIISIFIVRDNDKHLNNLIKFIISLIMNIFNRANKPNNRRTFIFDMMIII